MEPQKGPSNSLQSSIGKHPSLQILKNHNVRLQAKAACDYIRVGHEKQQVKCLVTLKADDFNEETKDVRYTPIHILCVIDVSGSMSGEKIDLVKKSLEYVITKMTSQDRMTLISFNNSARVLGEFTNSEAISSYIKGLAADGGTNIKAGLDEAYRTVLKYQNQRILHSIWLLSDGCDTSGFSAEQVSPHLREYFMGKNIPFITQTFGYGADHDPKIMKSLAQERSGNFKYIGSIGELGAAIGNALGGAESAIASKIVLKVGCKSKMESIQISKSFGQSFEYNPFTKEYSTTIYYFRAGSNSGFVFTVELPRYSEDMHLDVNKPEEILQVQATLQPLNPDEPPLLLKGTLSLPLLSPQMPGLPFRPLDNEVLEFYYRAVAIEEMRRSSALLSKGDYNQARKVLQAIKQTLERDAPGTDKIADIRQDIASMIEQIDNREYQEGQRRMSERAMCYDACYDYLPMKEVEKIVEVNRLGFCGTVEYMPPEILRGVKEKKNGSESIRKC